MKKKKTKRPPKCPGCRKHLDYVHENEYKTYNFNPKTGTYASDEFAGDLEIECPNCGYDLLDVFPEGACNYKKIDFLFLRRKTMKKILAVDIDGVLTDPSKCRVKRSNGWKNCEYSKCNFSECPARKGAREALLKLRRQFKIVIWSGRGEKDRKATKVWLCKHKIRYDKLEMGHLRYFKLIDDRALGFKSWKQVLRKLKI